MPKSFALCFTNVRTLHATTNYLDGKRWEYDLEFSQSYWVLKVYKANVIEAVGHFTAGYAAALAKGK
jgi:hypothetical protein